MRGSGASLAATTGPNIFYVCTESRAWPDSGTWQIIDVTVLGLVGGAPGGETPRVADKGQALVSPSESITLARSAAPKKAPPGASCTLFVRTIELSDRCSLWRTTVIIKLLTLAHSRILVQWL